MKKELVFLKMLALRTGFLLALFSACRLIFLLANRRFFPENVDFFESAGHFLSGLRFDISSLFWVNGLFILTSLLPFSFRKKGWFCSFQKWLFVAPNLGCLALELADVAWFPFNIRRTIASDFNLLLNTKNLWGRFLLENWWQVTLLFGAGFGLIRFFEKTDLLKNQPTVSRFSNLQTAGIQSFIFLFGIGGWVLGARGGWQLMPIMPVNAANFVNDPRWSPLLTNATMNLLVSVQQKFIEQKTWFHEAELDSEFSLRRQFSHPQDSLRRLNVVVISLESFGRENLLAGRLPFLESLEKVSFAPQKSYANGMRSSQGNGALMASLPALMTDPFCYSPYQSNKISGLAAILRQKGWSTAFFHGSNPGSMMLDKLAAAAGFEKTFDRWAMPDQEFYDGQWGIYDGPFYRFLLQKLEAMPQPFCAHFFSLTSHHPFRAEPFFEKMHPEMPPVERSFRYADEMLRQFFEEAARQPWFENTLFVLSADHTGPSERADFQTFEGKFRIPILFYCPKFLPAGQPEKVVSQVDVLPSILDFLKFGEPFSSFGQSVFSADSAGREPMAFMFEGGIFQLIDGENLLLFDGEKATGLFDFQADGFLQKNLMIEKSTLAARLERRLKAIIQRHNQAMILNQLAE